MVWSGLFILGYAGYQVYGTDLLNARAQETAREELAAQLEERRSELSTPISVVPDSTTTTVGPTPTTEPEDPIVLYPEEAGSEGEPVGVMRIPKLGVDEVLIEGVRPNDLKLGPGHMPWTPMPGQPGNAVISGHRTTYGRPFFDLDLLEPGDLIEVETALGTHVYAVRSSEIVSPTDVWVTHEREGAWLTLTTCNPKYSARERLIIFAELVDGPNLEYVEYLAGEKLAAAS